MSAQGFKNITLTTALKDSLPLLLHNDEASITCSAGIAFPTDNLKEGMLCYRSDLDCLYQYRKGVWIDILKQVNDDVTELGEAIIEAFEEIDGIVLQTKANETDFQALKTAFETFKADVENSTVGSGAEILSTLIPKSGDRGYLNGYEKIARITPIDGSLGGAWDDESDELVNTAPSVYAQGVPSDAYSITVSEDNPTVGTLTLYADRLPDSCYLAAESFSGGITLALSENTLGNSTSWVKILKTKVLASPVAFSQGSGSDWVWEGDEAPELSGTDTFVFYYDGECVLIKRLTYGTSPEATA